MFVRLEQPSFGCPLDAPGACTRRVARRTKKGHLKSRRTPRSVSHQRAIRVIARGPQGRTVPVTNGCGHGRPQKTRQVGDRPRADSLAATPRRARHRVHPTLVPEELRRRASRGRKATSRRWSGSGPSPRGAAINGAARPAGIADLESRLIRPDDRKEGRGARAVGGDDRREARARVRRDHSTRRSSRRVRPGAPGSWLLRSRGRDRGVGLRDHELSDRRRWWKMIESATRTNPVQFELVGSDVFTPPSSPMVGFLYREARRAP